MFFFLLIKQILTHSLDFGISYCSWPRSTTWWLSPLSWREMKIMEMCWPTLLVCFSFFINCYLFHSKWTVCMEVTRSSVVWLVGRLVSLCPKFVKQTTPTVFHGLQWNLINKCTCLSVDIPIYFWCGLFPVSSYLPLDIYWHWYKIETSGASYLHNVLGIALKLVHMIVIKCRYS